MKKQRIWGALALLCATGLILALAAVRTPVETDLAVPAAGELLFDPGVPREDIDALTPLQRAALAREAIGPVTALGVDAQQGGRITYGVSRGPDDGGALRFRVIFLVQWERAGLFPWEETLELRWDPFFVQEGDSIRFFTVENRGGEGVFVPDESADLPTEGQNALRRILRLTREDCLLAAAVTLRESDADGRRGTSMFWASGRAAGRGRFPWNAYLSFRYES